MKAPTVGSVLRYGVAAALTGVLLWTSHPRDVLAAAAQADPRGLLIAVLLVFVDRTLMAYRWLVLLRPVTGDSRPSLPVVMRIFFVSTFVGTFLPASVGGDAVRAYSLTRHAVSGAAAVASVFMDRVLGVLSILMLAAAGLFLIVDLATDPLVLVALLLTTAVCALVALIVFSQAAVRWAHRILALIPFESLQRLARMLVDAIRRYSSAHGDLANVLAGSVAVQVLRVLQGYYLGQALGITVPLATYFAFIPIILLVMLLPITVNGIGTSQAAFVWFFGRAGVPGAAAFTLSVLFVALGIVGNVPGAFLYATGRPRVSGVSDGARGR
jgi:uncharacterized protein (TIRG00374 family)